MCIIPMEHGSTSQPRTMNELRSAGSESHWLRPFEANGILKACTQVGGEVRSVVQL